VVPGAAKPLARPGIKYSEVHGESGLATAGGVAFPPLPPERKPVASKAVNYAYHCIHNHAARTPYNPKAKNKGGEGV
jgi:inosine-uridine nucleoside N-ribohydrolase